MVAKKIVSSFWVHLNKFDVNICVISGKVPCDNRVTNGKKNSTIQSIASSIDLLLDSRARIHLKL